MAIMFLRIACLISVLFPGRVLTSGISISDIAPTARSLRAAEKHNNLGRRDVKGCLDYDHRLHYLDDTTPSHAQFGARLGLEFTEPTLLLEDIEHHVSRIDCSHDEIRLHFHSEEAFDHAYKEFTIAEIFLVVTSHKGCNRLGERDPYIVTGTSADAEHRVIFLTASRVPWQLAVHTLALDFGQSDEQLTLRQHADLRPRQAAASSTMASATTTTSIAYPPTPSSSATSVNVTDSFSKSFIDKAILPPDPSFGDVSIDGPGLSAGIDVKCKNCTFQGTINLVAGSLSMGPYTSTNTTQGVLNKTEAVFDYIEDGFLEFRANGLGAHIELDSTVEASDGRKWTVPLPAIPITPLLIAGIASVGPLFEPTISAGFELESTFEFTTGFEVTIPNNSSVVLNLADRNGSTQQGFDNTNVTLLPFQASTPDISLTLTAGFQPRLLLAISFFSGDALAGAGFFLDAPTLTTTLSTITHADSKCNNATASTPQSDIFDALTHIESSVEVGVGVIAQAEVRFLGSEKLKDEKEHEILSKEFMLPTGCLGFDAGAKTYGVPAATGTGIQGQGQGGKGNTSGASRMCGSSGSGVGVLMAVLSTVVGFFAFSSGGWMG